MKVDEEIYSSNEIMILSGGVENIMARKVTEEEFYNTIGKLDVTVTPKGNFPYQTDFCLRYGKRVGYTKPVDQHGFLDEYYLED